MDSTSLMLFEFYSSVATFAAIAVIYFVPWARSAGFARAVKPILLAHSLRHIGLIYLIPQVVPELPPPQFATSTAWGDVATAMLAFVALVALRRGPGIQSRIGRIVVWAFNVVGFVDLGYATYTAREVHLMTYKIGVAYVLPVIVVPALIVSHVVVFWLLLRKELR